MGTCGNLVLTDVKSNNKSSMEFSHCSQLIVQASDFALTEILYCFSEIYVVDLTHDMLSLYKRKDLAKVIDRVCHMSAPIPVHPTVLDPGAMP